MQVNGTTYYYVTNLQGDVMGLVDTSGNSVASYTYDPYGKLLTATGTLAEKKPLRYRGYYYDSESSLYYLQSRYYDPAVRRFINADRYASTGQGIVGGNAFEYGLNNPVCNTDSCGCISRSITMDILSGNYIQPVVSKARDQKSGFINGQSNQPYSKDSFGLGSYGSSGCAVIATYNALQFKRHQMSLSSIAEEYLLRDGTLLFGAFGVDPLSIHSFLVWNKVKHKTYLNGSSLEKAMKGNDVAIITIMNDRDDVFAGFHTVAVRCNGNEYDVYNHDNRKDKPQTLCSLSELWKEGYFICGYLLK